MAPAIVLPISFAVLRCLGLLGLTALNHWDTPLHGAIGAMFLLTASPHWGRGRPDLIRRVPPVFPSPGTIVSVTGVLEIPGAVGLLIPATARAAATCLAVLLVAMFPANIRAARERLTILGHPAMGIALRGAIQVMFVGAGHGADIRVCQRRNSSRLRFGTGDSQLASCRLA
jgi:uncharacterized membrane protein